MKITKKAIKNLMANYDKDSIENNVLNEALEHDDPKVFFIDLLQHGCQSGMVGDLVYYSDTAKFYDKHYDQIEELREQYEEEAGEPLQIKGDLRNWFAWFAFEETARKLYINDLNQEW